jgi:hypothetical protein
VPSGYVLQSRPRRGLLIAGSIMVGVPYFIGLSFGGDLEDEDAWLYVPVLGPWFTLAGKDFSCGNDSLALDCETDRSIRTLLILDGLTQGAGAVMLIYGLASKSQRLVRQDLYQGFTLTPHFTGSSAGLWAAGQF